MKNTIKLEIPSINSICPVALDTVKSLLKQNDVTAEDTSDVCTAVKEALDNCIQHAYADEWIKPIFVSLSLEDRNFTATIRDTGIGIQNIEQARTPLFSTLADASGMGFTIMESFMDSVKVRSNPEKGTTVTLKKELRIKK